VLVRLVSLLLMLFSSSLALAQEVVQPIVNEVQENVQSQAAFSFPMMILMLFAIFYFLVLRPQGKQLKQHQEMLNSLKKGDCVVTSGGIIGTVVQVQDDSVLMDIAVGVKVKVLKSQISRWGDKEVEKDKK